MIKGSKTWHCLNRNSNYKLLRNDTDVSGFDSEFNYIHFGIKINKCLKFVTPKIYYFSKKFKKNLRILF